MTLALLAALSVMITTAAFAPVAAAATACASNKIVCENALPGAPDSDWDISGAGDQSIQGFATQMSVNLGQRVDFKIKTDAAAYGLQIFRLGYYQNLGARKIADVTPSVTLPQTQPACATDPATEIYDCGTWGVSASWTVPADAVSGVYLALLTRPDTGGRSQIPFIVRDDASTSDVVFQTSDATWQAYNTYGGSNFYTGLANGRAFKLSYNRPFATRGLEQGRDYLFANEFPMLKFLERNGYDLSYISSLDTDQRGANLRNHKLFVSTGHDEYWSQGQRDNVEAARDAGVNLAFFSGNEVYWKTRWEASQDGSSTPNRTLVCYKDTWADKPLDPVSPTSTWRDARGAAEPENALTGTIYKSNNTDLPITVSGAEGKLRFWRNTGLGDQAATATTALAPHTVGYESDEDLDNGFRPAGLIRMSTTTGSTTQYLTDFGRNVVPGTTTHNLTLYRAASGALVFGAGTVQWAWGLDTYHDGTVAPVDTRMQQATVNLFADMSAFPASLSSPGIVAATKSTDSTAPVATITSPAVTATLPQGSAVTVSGTATDTGGGIVAGVEVSLDGGRTWHPATGRASWSYRGIVLGTGANTIRARAIDDSGNIQASPTCLSTNAVCPCTVFGAALPDVPAAADTSAVTLGLRFTPTVDGFVTGVRFYKGTGNTGQHTGTLYSASGAVLATVTFTDETATGWQTATFAPAAAVTAGTAYVIAYTAPSGNYAADSWYFGYRGVVSGPLSTDGGTSLNGLYTTGVGFPTRSYNQTNYYVDPVFSLTDTTPISVTSASPVDGAGSVPVTAPITGVLSRSALLNSVLVTVKTSAGTTVAGSVAYDDTTRKVVFTPAAPLAYGTTYTVSMSATAAVAGIVSLPGTWSFTTVRPPQTAGVCPCSLYDDGDVPVTAAADDTASVEVGTAFSTDSPGQLTGVEFYKGIGNGGSHTVSLWSSDGTRLATAAVKTESTVGWQVASFDAPVAVTANTTYVVSYRAPQGRYAVTPGALAAPKDRAPLHTPAQAGRYGYGTGAPVNSSSASYFVDPVFTVSAANPPAVARVTPADKTTSTPVSTQVGVTFDASVQAGSATVTLTGPGGTAVPGTMSDPAVGATVTFTPTNPLAAGTTYTVTVAGARNLGGTAMTTPATSKFTTSGTAVCPCTLLASSAAPATPDAGDGSALTVGTRFQASTNGYVLGLRYWRSAANTGSHTGALWTATGQKLADVSFTDSGTGWQTAKLATPVAVTAGTAYVASVYMPNGHYAAVNDFFAAPYVNEPLTGTQGLYATGDAFPTASYRNTAYYVDPVFTLTADVTAPVVTKLAATGSGTTATVTWTTDEAADGSVAYGTAPTTLTSTAAESGSSTDHSVKLTGLTPFTTYYVRVTSADAAGNAATAPTADLAPVSFVQAAGGTNLAKGRTATQSSTAGTGLGAGDAVDGSTDGVLANGSITQTNADAWSWWQVDLAGSYQPDQLAIWNRTDANSDRLRDYWVFVSDTAFDTTLTPVQQAAKAGVWSSHQTSAPAPVTAITLPARTQGRYVMVQQGTQNQVLSLAEVQVLGSAKALGVTAGPVDFGSVVAGTTKTAQVTLTNPGATPITVTGSTAPKAPFALSPSLSGTVVAPGATVSATVSYAPTAAATADTGSFAVTADDGNGTTTVTLKGSAYVPVVNVAKGRTATQSSLYPGSQFLPGRAVDGNTDGVMNNGSVSHTNTDRYSWWQVDLAGSYKPDSIVIWNRTDCCTDRLKDYYVFVSDSPFDTSLTPAQQAAKSGVWSSRQTTIPSPSTTIALPAGTKGRYVMVQENVTYTYLSLAEVQVLVKPGALAVSDSSLDFGTVTTGASKSATLTLSNSGATPVTITGFAGLAAPYTAAPDATGKVIPAGGSLTVTLTYAPTSAGTDKDTLNVTADDGQGTTAVALTGTANTPTPVSTAPTGGPAAGTYQVMDYWNLVLDTLNGASAAGSPLTGAAVTTSYGQRWKLQPMSDGSYKIVNGVTGRIVGIEGASRASGAAAVVVDDKTSADVLWKLTTRSNGYTLVNVNSGLPLVVLNDSGTPDARLGQATDSGQRTLVWRFNAMSAAPTPMTTAPAGGPAAGTYQVTNVWNLAMNTLGGATAEGTALTSSTATTSANQSWKLQPMSDGTYKIVHVASGRIVAVSGASKSWNAPVVLTDDKVSTDALWKITVKGNGYTLVNVNSGLPLMVLNDSSTPDARLVQIVDVGQKSAVWRFTAR